MEQYILKDENAIYYECGFSCDNVIFLKLGEEKYFITDSRYVQEAKENAPTCQVIQANDGLENELVSFLKKTSVKEIMFDPSDFTLSSFSKIESKLKINFIQELHFSKLKRIIKSDEEIKLLRKASVLGKEGFDRLAKYLRANGEDKSEKLIHFKAKQNLSANGKYGLSFEPIIGINENGAKPHALPSKNCLKDGDILLVDAGIKYKRYCSDRTCTSYVDFETINFKRSQTFKNPKHQKIYDLVYKAHQNAVEKARVGMKASDIDNLTRSVIEEAGYGKYFVHSTGHGVGVDIHEFPVISAKNTDVVIEDNMVYTIEPGIYLPNEFGVRIEDTIVMTDGKAHIL